MAKSIEIRITPDKIKDEEYIREKAIKEANLREDQVKEVRVIRRSLDSRGRRPKFVLRVKVFERLDDIEEPIRPDYSIGNSRKRVLIVGAGPAGYFAALRLLEQGVQPIVIDRGKDVRARRKDLRAIQQFHNVNPNSNYCFGEGGAGTYSDGKLYTRANKRGNIKKMLSILVDHGADSEILIDAHPHIGSNKLPQIVSAIRETIIQNGGEVHFERRLVDFVIDSKGKFVGGVLATGESISADAVILATGHSARDIYELCFDKRIEIEFKPFAIGVRVEHPQSLIDEIQYNQAKREDNLPAASYGIACQVGGHGVFSFCMCPGGLIVPAATHPGELVVNGMSLSRRDSPYANAGTVVTLDENPYPQSPLGGMVYQRELEQSIFDYGDGSQKAPAQRMTDFAAGRLSPDVGSSSYIPGIYSAPMHDLLPAWIAKSLQQAVRQFDKKMKGYYTSEAHIIGLESRTSAPIRIPRDPDTLMAVKSPGLFPCGEGAGYAGGILSAALDGERVADAVAQFVHTI